MRFKTADSGERKAAMIIAAPSEADVIHMAGDVELLAGGEDGKGPRQFNIRAYTGGELRVNGFDLPVVVDLKGMTFAKDIKANLDHDSKKRVGHITATANDGSEVTDRKSVV